MPCGSACAHALLASIVCAELTVFSSNRCWAALKGVLKIGFIKNDEFKEDLIISKDS